MIRYIYIDDQPDKAGGIAAGLSITDYLKVVLCPAESWNDQIKTIQKTRGQIDGLLLDLQLRIPQETLSYDAPALAQQLRNLAKEGTVQDMPIILCTTDEFFMETYDKSTNDDLFDRIYYKDSWSPRVKEQDFKEFVSLAEGYKRIVAEDKNLAKLIQTPHDHVLVQLMDKIPESKTVHGIASFILKQLVLIPGLLVTEDLLAIRLGIDLQNSADWHIIKEKLDEYQYQGVFSDAWPRWWMGDIMKWWRKFTDGQTLRNMKAADKIEILKNGLGLSGITAIQLPAHHNQDTFWYKCCLSGVPLSGNDGFLIKGQDKKLDWQDRDYISLNHLWTIDSASKETIVLDKVPYNDIENVKSIFSKKRQG